jgi:predicted ArsR family transcriptional regulator
MSAMAGHRRSTTDQREGAVLGDSRARVLEVLQSSTGPLGVDEVAASTGLHPNTVRFHLDGLLGVGLVERSTEERTRPGRPRTLYNAPGDQPPAGRRSYRLLAQILADYLAAHSARPERTAQAAGEEWGRRVLERPAPLRRVDATAATRQLTYVLEDIGFAPEAVTRGRRREILLHHCPFREAAERDASVVCAVHLGLMRGALAEIGAPLRVTGLDPFVEPRLCVAHLSTGNDGAVAQRRVGRPGGGSQGS